MNNSWQQVENAINNEKHFLLNNLCLSPYEQNDPISCHDCLFRLMAIQIVSGRLKIKKILIEGRVWGDDCSFDAEHKMHGAKWHDSTIKKIASYFTHNGHNCIMEPSLIVGRADLGVPDLKLFFEVGTVNLYKLYVTILNLKHSKIILVPGDEYIIELTV